MFNSREIFSSSNKKPNNQYTGVKWPLHFPSGKIRQTLNRALSELKRKGKCRTKSQHEYAKTGQRRKKVSFFFSSRVALEVAGGFGYADKQNQLWCFGLQVADIASKINKSNAVCLPERKKRSCCFDTISVLNSRFYSSDTNIDTPNCNMSHLFSRWGGIKETIERRREMSFCYFTFFFFHWWRLSWKGKWK